MELKESIISIVDRIGDELKQLSHNVHDNPKLGLQEYKAVEWQTELLLKHGFEVNKPFCGMETAFKAIKGTPGKGP